MAHPIIGFDLSNTNSTRSAGFTEVKNSGFKTNARFPSALTNFYFRQAFAASDGARLIFPLDPTRAPNSSFNIPVDQQGQPPINGAVIAHDPIYYYSATSTALKTLILSTAIDSDDSHPYFPIGQQIRIHNQKATFLALKSDQATPQEIANLRPGEVIGVRRITDSGANQFIVEATNSTATPLQLLDLFFPVNTRMLTFATDHYPPGGDPATPIAGVVWTAVPEAQGAIMIGEKGGGVWDGTQGAVGGSADPVISQSTDPMTDANLIPHAHGFAVSDAIGSGGKPIGGLSEGTGSWSTYNFPTDPPIGISLSNARRYLVKLWKRTA